MPRKVRSMGKVIKIIRSFISAAILALIVLPVALSLLLYLPWIQDFARRAAAGFLSDKLQTVVSVDKLHLKLFSRVTLDGFYVQDYHGDTLLYAGRIVGAPAKPECLYRGRDARPCGPRGRPFRSDAGQHPDEQSETDIAKNQAQGETGKEKKIPASCRRRNDPGHGFPASQVRCEASRVRRQFHGSGRAPLQSEGPRRFGRGRQRRFGDRLADAARTLRSAYPQPFDAGVRHFGNGHALRRSAADHRRVGRADGLSLFRLRHVERV